MPSLDSKKKKRKENQAQDNTLHSARYPTLEHLPQILNIHCWILDCMFLLDRNYLCREVVFTQPTLLAVSPGTSQFREAKSTADSGKF